MALDTGALTEAAVNWGPGQPSGDYPRGLLVSTSTDGTTWSAPVSATGSGQITTVDLPGGPARYVRARADGHRRVLVVGRRPSPLHLTGLGGLVTRRSSTA